MTVAVLFARSDSFYKTMPGCDVWDIERDARKWQGGAPVVAHPPCRAWGRYAHKAKPREGEKQLAIEAVRFVRENGGVLEHPATSRLWPHLRLPAPGAPPDEFGGWSLLVFQSWFGHRAPKETILYIVGCAPEDLPPMPAQLNLEFGRIEFMCTRERESTPAPFAEWLCELARRCRPS